MVAFLHCQFLLPLHNEHLKKQNSPLIITLHQIVKKLAVEQWKCELCTLKQKLQHFVWRLLIFLWLSSCCGHMQKLWQYNGLHLNTGHHQRSNRRLTLVFQACWYGQQTAITNRLLIATGFKFHSRVYIINWLDINNLALAHVYKNSPNHGTCVHVYELTTWRETQSLLLASRRGIGVADQDVKNSMEDAP